MNRRLRLAGAAGVGGVAGSYAVTGYSRQFVVAPIDAFVVRATPGRIVSFMITNVGSEAHVLHVALALVAAIGALGAAGLVGYLGAQQIGLRPRVVGPALGGVLAWGVTVGLTGLPVESLGAAVPVALLVALEASSGAFDRDATTSSQRRVLLAELGSLGVAVLAGGAGVLRAIDVGRTAGTETDAEAVSEPTQTSEPTVEGEAEPESTPEPSEVEQLLGQAESQSLAFAGDGLPGLVSEIGSFYNVDIAQFDPELPPEDWSLTFTGEVGSERTITFEELTDRPVEHRYVTLRCVGESLNGKKLDTAVWTGTPLKPLLDEVDPQGACGCAMLRAEDDYFVQFPVDALEDAFLAWEMNGQALPTSHGHPVRVLVPGHWGETNVKWVTEIELLEAEADGYWEQRGWHGTGPVNTVAKLWSTTTLEDGRVEVAGHAYAGTRGIERVEVSTDGGSTWTDAELSEPLPGSDVWRQWRHVYEADSTHEVVVRAIDGTGTMQPKEQSDAFPSGSTGWVSETVRP
ncbi:molybdopterin-dependent oxidoreductase [Halobellus clavatus]|uniref:DMSO/TMAO reductase YedYZ, molybdopterin-dependent catalytic subunit n=1 Tax=Halobellus clavatus TaxID=660517 RepID=A0A1H3GY00_9EURY|nr:molybdopterin-dependent oxidoreductase [Halobellus clavatus]SDY08121.1 DMSO/TMAO reductase YedYZ, molybdopterin-dependent catalytic subunit [Halobellus clavatus]